MSAILTRESISQAVCRLAADQASVSPAEVSLNTHLFNDLNFDSLDAVEFAMTIEEEFELEIGDEKAERVRTVKDAVELVCAELAV